MENNPEGDYDPGPLLASIDLFEFPLLFLGQFSWGILIGIFVVIFLLIASALVSGSEIAFFSINPEQKEDLENEKSGVSNRILALIAEPNYLLATILVANNIFNIGLILTTSFVIGQLFPGLVGWMDVLINVLLITFLLVLFGEVTPKVYATQYNMQMARLTATPLFIMKQLFLPFSAVLVKSTKLIDKRLQSNNHKDFDIEEINQAIDIVTEGGTTQEDREMLKGIIKFGNVPVTQVMKARVDVIAIESTISFSELCNVVIESGFSRIPVYREDFDEIIGVAYAKDLLEYIDESDEFDWLKLMRKPFFIPETKKIDDLLKDFQERRIHIAIVVDEYGGTSGIVTLEDVLEEVVGEIVDEFDKGDELNFTQLNKHTYKFDGKTLLRDISKILDIDRDAFDEIRGEADSLAGLLLELKGEFPKKNEELKYQNFVFTVMSKEDKRIKNVKITILENETVESEEP